jgi:AAA family ATP:ADP antiporter
MAIFWRMNRSVLTAPEFDTLRASRTAPKMKTRLSIKQSIAYLSNSKYLMCLAIIVIAYNLVINLVEIVWKDKLYQLYPSTVDYNNYMAHLTTATCMISSAAALFMPRIIARFGWTSTALITPIVMLLTCGGFFTFLFAQNLGAFALLGASPLAIAVFFGAAQNCLSKAAKFSVFDATKEMAFIPLDHDTKLKGKAAIDGVGSRLGKSGGSLIHQGLFILFGQLAFITPYVAAILFCVIILWIFAAKALGTQFNSLISEKADEDFPIEKPREDAPTEQWQLSRNTQQVSA